MSRSFHWKPVIVPPVGGVIQLDMYRILCDYLSATDNDNLMLTGDDVLFLEGVAAAASPELRQQAFALIRAVKEHNGVSIEVSW